MLFWIVFLVMIAAAVLCILLPLSRANETAKRSVDALDVYREQLSQLDANLGKTDADVDTLSVERAEIARRILKESRRAERAKSKFKLRRSGRLVTSLVALLFIPAMSLSIYSTIGSPGLPDSPVSAQRQQKLQDQSVDEMVLTAERHLAKNPEDKKGWEVLANVYGRLDRADDRARALQQIVRISGPTPELLTDLGEALTVAAGNIVPARAREMFETALRQNANNPKASLYLALALEQEGRFADALKRWEQLSTIRKDDPQWQSMATERLANLRRELNIEKPGNPTAADVENAAQMSSTDRVAMIETMVEGLAEKLRDEPGNFDGWARLIRSYVVLKRTEDASTALVTARTHFANSPSVLEKLNGLGNDLGLNEKPTSGESN